MKNLAVAHLLLTILAAKRAVQASNPPAPPSKRHKMEGKEMGGEVFIT